MLAQDFGGGNAGLHMRGNEASVVIKVGKMQDNAQRDIQGANVGSVGNGGVIDWQLLERGWKTATGNLRGYEDTFILN